ncbi:hypothetical protein F2Q68_00004129 [Brassica cretica]|uniref:Uncharacterized protein n=1 Tax=Brassica cretica TaxID=69181 RepID=A0A8S9JEH5_BRACR|nr:hypothetical protein F2Q68_00004129 [Brassica cretica]
MANYWLSFSGSSPTVWSLHVYLYLGKSQVDFDSLEGSSLKLWPGSAAFLRSELVPHWTSPYVENIPTIM